jgi:hypothetical protein
VESSVVTEQYRLTHIDGQRLPVELIILDVPRLVTHGALTLHADGRLYLTVSFPQATPDGGRDLHVADAYLTAEADHIEFPASSGFTPEFLGERRLGELIVTAAVHPQPHGVSLAQVLGGAHTWRFQLEARGGLNQPV